jgi:hypothetical protein
MHFCYKFFAFVVNIYIFVVTIYPVCNFYLQFVTIFLIVIHFLLQFCLFCQLNFVKRYLVIVFTGVSGNLYPFHTHHLSPGNFKETNIYIKVL